jgi:hypothetical protein
MRLALGLLILLAGCAGRETKPDPGAGDAVELPVTKFLPIDAALLVPCAIATGPLSQVVEVARARRESLETCNGQLDAIRKLQESIKP